MLDVGLTERIIEKLADCTDYNINIMDEKGIFIASTDKSRIGTFHEAAFEIVQKNLESREITGEDTFLGTREGVNMALKYKNRTIGVLGLTGEIEKVKIVALVVKKMVETMIEFESHKEKTLKRKTEKERFINSLFYEDISRRELASMAQSLGYPDVPRIPILLTCERLEEEEMVREKLRDHILEKRQDDIFIDERNGEILIFKGFRGAEEGFFENYKYEIGDYLGRLLRYMQDQEIEYRIYVGSLQSTMVYYRYGYQHCRWLRKNVFSSKRSVFFYDHLDEYLKSQTPFMEFHQIFEVFGGLYTDEFKKMYIENIGALYEHNYSLQESSSSIFVHKNTLIFRLDKIRRQLGLNPFQSDKDKELLNAFYYYLKQLA